MNRVMLAFFSQAGVLALAALAGVFLLAATPAWCQDDSSQPSQSGGYQITDDNSQNSQTSSQSGGYQIGENGGSSSDQSSTGNSQSDQNSGPVRMARFSYITGNVTWRPDDTSDWSDASVNLPIRQGAEVWVNNGGRAEIQFDDGSYVRLGDGAVATLQTLYSDSNGEFTEIRMNQGLAFLRLANEHSQYQVDGALGAAKAYGPARFRVGSGDGLEIAVRSGAVSIDSSQGQADMHDGDYLYIADDSSPLNIQSIPGHDSWDSFNDQRDQEIDDPTPSSRYLPASIHLVAGDLDDYGTWHHDDAYGDIWVPTVSNDPDWRPYYHGHWVWVNPFGWTWVSSKSWGWAPYHYGTWVHSDFGWAWVPGPARQYWSPAVVHFTTCDNNIAWAPLAPEEIHYPAVISVGYNHGNWWTNFSVGGCAVYQPAGPTWCEPQPWHNTYINQTTIVNNNTTIINYNNPQPGQRPTAPVGVFPIQHPWGGQFIPRNTRFAAVTQVPATGFDGGHFVPVHGPGATLFQRGQSVGGTIGGRFVAGPMVAPSRMSYSPTHTVATAPNIPTGMFNRPVYRTALPPTIARTSAPTGRFFTQAPQGGRPITYQGQQPTTVVPVRRTPTVTTTNPVQGHPNPQPTNGGWGTARPTTTTTTPSNPNNNPSRSTDTWHPTPTSTTPVNPRPTTTYQNQGNQGNTQDHSNWTWHPAPTSTTPANPQPTTTWGNQNNSGNGQTRSNWTWHPAPTSTTTTPAPHNPVATRSNNGQNNTKGDQNGKGQGKNDTSKDDGNKDNGNNNSGSDNSHH